MKKTKTDENLSVSGGDTTSALFAKESSSNFLAYNRPVLFSLKEHTKSGSCYSGYSDDFGCSNGDCAGNWSGCSSGDMGK